MVNMKKYLYLFCFLFGSIFLGNATEIKFATLAPEGSTWMKVFQEWNTELTEKTKGELKFKVYAGGIAGDEKDMVRKIRLGQLHAGGFTGVGLGEIAPQVRVLDSPFLFRDAKEADYITEKFENDFREEFDRKGYVFLGWAEVGFVYFFTSKPVERFSDLKNLKMWIWEGDPEVEAMYSSLGINPVPLSIADVMTSLQTGLINGVYASPLAAMALQWTARTGYMFDFRLANSAGAVLVSKKIFDKLTDDQKQLLRETGKKYMRKLTELSRAENEEAIQFFKKNNVKILPPKDASENEIAETAGKKARLMLAGKLYDQAMLEKIETSLTDLRKKSK